MPKNVIDMQQYRRKLRAPDWYECCVCNAVADICGCNQCGAPPWLLNLKPGRRIK